MLRPTHVSDHALIRFSEHFQDAAEPDLLDDLTGGIELPAGIAAPLLGRSLRGVQDVYILGRARRGIHVVSGARVVTYLRLEADRQAWVERHYPVEGASPQAGAPCLHDVCSQGAAKAPPAAA